MQKVMGTGGDCGLSRISTYDSSKGTAALWIRSVRYLGFSEKLKNVKFPKF